MKRLITGIIAAVVVTCTPLTAFADIGIWGGNMPTDSATPYMFEDRVISVYSNETDNDPDLSEVYPGSFLYIPIMVDTGTEEENWQQATEKQIKDDKVTVSHKVTYGSRYIDSVTIVDGKKEKISGVSSGAFAKIRVNDSYTNTRPTNVVVKLVLSVNRVSYQGKRAGNRL